MEYGREKCLLAKIIYEKSDHECGWGGKLSPPAEGNDASLRKLLKPLFVSEIYDILRVQTVFLTILTAGYLILPQASYPS